MKTAALPALRKSTALMIANAILWGGAMIACAIQLKGDSHAAGVNSTLAFLFGFSLLINFAAISKDNKKRAGNRKIAI